ncbi:MAG: pyrroloquinoline quinone precursor peptide PqqA [Oscillospiraceae bacterium]|nr:pyrroloquinoline quinone precursor peptide PqqA [Oscillospiraceae bacterium]
MPTFITMRFAFEVTLKWYQSFF